MVPMFGLWSICDNPGRAPLEDGGLAPPCLRGHHLEHRRRPGAGAGCAGGVGAVPAPPHRCVTGAGRGSVLVDPHERLPGRCRDARGPAHLPQGPYAPSRAARPAGGHLSADLSGDSAFPRGMPSSRSFPRDIAITSRTTRPGGPLPGWASITRISCVVLPRGSLSRGRSSGYRRRASS